MIKILNKQTNEVYTLHGANKEFATKDSCIVDRLVGNTFRRNWKIVFSYFIPLGSSTQLLLNDGFEVIL